MTPLLVLLGTIAGAWYLLIVRPQKDQQTRHGRLVERLQVGDHVLTVGGIYGRVVAVESATVVLELAPGLTSRIATDGIARIVHGAEAALPTQATYDGAPTPSLPPMAMEDDMHQHPHPHPHEHPHQQAPAGQPAMVQHAPTTVMPQQPFAQLPAPAAPGAATTLRAQVVPAQTYEPRPWGDVQPRGAQPVQHAQFAPPAPPAQYAQYQPPVAYAQPVQYAQPHAPQGYAPQYAPPQPQYAQPQPAFVPPPAPMPVHVPFSQPAPQLPQPAQPLQYQVHAAQPMQVAPGMPAPQQLAVPQAGHQQHAHPHAHPHAEPALPEIDGRRYSRAPKGMGSSLRLDDPTLADTIARARSERADLAVEYRKLTAPLVALDEPTHQHPHAPAHAPQLVGHDPSGVALFATPGVPGVFPLEQYPAPAPAHVAIEHGVPRPGVSPHGASADPALHSNAFQRPAPYAPPRPEAPPANAGHAHSHA